MFPVAVNLTAGKTPPMYCLGFSLSEGKSRHSAIREGQIDDVRELSMVRDISTQVHLMSVLFP